MQKEISGVTAGILIAAVVIIVGVIAYFTLVHQTKATPEQMKASMEKGMAEQMRARYGRAPGQPVQPAPGH